MSTAASTRSRLRWLHLLTAAVVGTHIYSPWSDVAWFDLTVKAIVIPAISLTGIWMWQQGRIARWLRGRS